MKKYNILVNDTVVMTVEALNENRARQIARKAGHVFCSLEEVRDPLPGESEYGVYLEWARIRKNTSFDHDGNIFRKIAMAADTAAEEAAEDRERQRVNTWPLTAEQSEKAADYARFLGAVVYDRFLADWQRSAR